jgi:hypothetical protein
MLASLVFLPAMLRLMGQQQQQRKRAAALTTFHFPQDQRRAA